MRLKVSLYSERRQIIDVNYNYQLAALINNFLMKSKNTSIVEMKLKEKVKKKKLRMFCFSKLFIAQSKIVGSEMEVKGSVDWYISSPSKELLCEIAQALINGGKIKIGRSEFNIVLAEVIQMPDFTENMKFKVISPIVISTIENGFKKEKKLKFKPDKVEFVEIVKKNLIKKSKLFYGNIFTEEDIDVSFDEGYKRDKGKFITFKNNLLKCYQIPVNLKCDERLMRVAYDCGIGEKNLSGFGCLDIIAK